MSLISYAYDVERQAGLDIQAFPQVTRNMPNIRDRAGQGCFLCLENPREGQYAVLVPCLRPAKARRVVGQAKVFTDNPKPIYEKTMPWNYACESDNDIYQRLVDTSYQYLGWWKKLLPYYGITEVLEVNFHFAGVVEPDGRYPIRMEPVNPDKVSEECEVIIKRHPSGPYIDINDACLDDYCHNDECRINMEVWSQPCIRIDAEKAEERRNRLQFLPLLKECGRASARANGLQTMEGLAQESCIYDTKGPNRVLLPLPNQKFRGTVRMRGLHFVLGLQKDRMRIELPFRISCAWFGVAFIWLCLVLWRWGGGDWETALAFAQVVAASISIVIVCAQ
ncbi:uncharacterized protein GGS22DRAFT_182051 [Annulohypoxylon maeteangense]|uniref:uncharacterized protein n=1 Tax=Annulohypoxylon maeteangense TaxID=1927788 RepID=UPI0020077D28|nr:uncharacterized protein GGS22DRAFT_182051 [Annulohypoxylon maeteangense]KAI0880727.1 hypothetical protein GGS22DRAFT_182051 [Annulohypoxylon maeteangense]